jgi:hypothetical protein
VKFILGLIGLVIVLFSLPFLIMAVIDLATGGSVGMDILIGLFVFFLLTTLTGLFLIRYGFKNLKSEKKMGWDDIEQMVLGLAQTEGGKITTAETSLKCGLSIKKSKEALEKLVNEGVAELQVSETGSYVYYFPGLLSEEQKHNTEPV